MYSQFTDLLLLSMITYHFLTLLLTPQPSHHSSIQSLFLWSRTKKKAVTNWPSSLLCWVGVNVVNYTKTQVLTHLTDPVITDPHPHTAPTSLTENSEQFLLLRLSMPVRFQHFVQFCEQISTIQHVVICQIGKF